MVSDPRGGFACSRDSEYFFSSYGALDVHSVHSITAPSIPASDTGISCSVSFTAGYGTGDYATIAFSSFSVPACPTCGSCVPSVVIGLVSEEGSIIIPFVTMTNASIEALPISYVTTNLYFVEISV